MTLLTFLLWIVVIILDTVGQISFKVAATKSVTNTGKQYWLSLFYQPWVWLGIAAYFSQFLLWMAFITIVPLSKAILLASFNMISVMIVGRILFKEYITPLRQLGIVLITAGVMLVGVF